MEKYDVISVVGEGSYGLVMRCRHRESGQYVAIKKFLETEDDPTVRKMAIREIRMLKKLRHENLVNMIEVFRRKKRFFLVFEYLEHTILEELEARSGGGLGYITSRKYIYQVLRALDFIHSNNVIHRDIKPENVLVSRLGVIKLCDFGFARPFQENETFTDYVATRWYRSPELLVGDPRYGKEVDIWATGCLYSEMITGEPIFPGESDVDQLFQIVRILGKVNARHQLLITRNTMFKGMKQEQNSSLAQMFPDWNRDSLNFLNQCLKMDGATRPDTTKLLKHELFTRDDFVDHFLPELRSKLHQELQGNPLLKRLHAMANPIRKPEERKSSNGSITEKSSKDLHKQTKGQIGLSLTQILNQNPPPDKTSMAKFPEPSSIRSSQGSDELSFNLAHYKHYLTTQHNKSMLNNTSKGIHINNLTLSKDSHITNGGGASQLKYGARILSAKHHKTTTLQQQMNEKTNSNGSNGENIQIQPPSPVQFQSLQHESVTNSQFANLMDKQLTQSNPLTINNLTLNGSNIPSYFANKRSTNLLNNNLHRPPISQVITNSNQMAATKYSPLPLGAARTNLAKRERGLLLDVGHLPYGTSSNHESTVKSVAEPSPRMLPTPAWLMGNLKITSHGKTTQIGKKGMTDWKSVSQNANVNSSSIGPSIAATAMASNTESNHLPEISLPSCPGATSPAKQLKKKLTPMTNLTTNMHPNVSFGNALDASYFATPRNFSASSQKENET